MIFAPQKSHVSLKAALHYPGENTSPSTAAVVFLTSATSIASTAQTCSLNKYLLRLYLCQLDIITGSEDMVGDADSPSRPCACR